MFYVEKRKKEKLGRMRKGEKDEGQSGEKRWIMC
jgi:hypothetical protein